MISPVLANQEQHIHCRAHKKVVLVGKCISLGAGNQDVQWLNQLEINWLVSKFGSKLRGSCPAADPHLTNGKKWLFWVGLKNKKPRFNYEFEVLNLFDWYSAEEEGYEPNFMTAGNQYFVGGEILYSPDDSPLIEWLQIVINILSIVDFSTNVLVEVLQNIWQRDQSCWGCWSRAHVF